ncbi:outer membrane receptor protein involved in Fe transport [Breznakibacter xylanolyticus]|uniref:Outer membrane receptor protein involved in Fe transport n=1 Tax=Breznakibacter xylanolyticus TaxID=990 RepID=A0A2W7QBM0_9BACT|nr:TonB-dependent receptor [Breznakibacter xylanolyticus]PZX19149.1 outer membrane receptor protein involved in Fe transport [Breznakibacter xylanolyticus]
MKKTLSFLAMLFVCLCAMAEPLDDNRKPVISGYIKDAQTGEMLVGATVFLRENQSGVTTNTYGFYSLAATPGDYTLAIAFLGYRTIEKKINHSKDQSLNVSLEPDVAELSEIQVTAERAQDRIAAPQMGMQKLQAKTIKEVPALMGEVDAIKVIQLLPGVQAASEGSSGFSVRGGNPDQNLILLDEAIVYNAGHMMGFFSVFNNDAIKDVNLYKGDIPAKNGGRLASLLDIRMKDGNNQKFSGTGGIGTISSRLTLEGPIVNEKTQFVLAGRRTYADLFLPFASKERAQDSKLYFYDLNAKVSHTFSDRDRVFISAYLGRDVFGTEGIEMDFGNQTLTARWNHVFSPVLFSNLTLTGSQYDYHWNISMNDASGFDWKSELNDYSAKLDFNYYPNTNNQVTFGVQSIRHNVMPGLVKGTGTSSMYDEIRVPDTHAWEHAAYIENTQKISERINLRYGLRVSEFQNIGKGTHYSYDNNYEVTDTTEYASGNIFNTYWGLEPRAGITYVLTPTASIKGSYSRTYQYMQLASNSTSGTPLDVWYPSSPNVKPQIADQFAVGFFKNIFNNTVEMSIEGFYKNMQNSIDFKDYPNLLLNKFMEGELRFGKSIAYGAEFLARFNLHKWNGWVSYTLSRSERQINGINNNKWYLSPYDHPHDCSVVVNYSHSKRVSYSANWVYLTGAPATFPVGRFESGGNIVPIYSDRNAERMPDYHRLDLSATIRGKEKPGRKWQGEWVFSLYNAYAQHNAWIINFVEDEENPGITKAEKTYLFTFVPAVTYNFKF